MLTNFKELNLKIDNLIEEATGGNILQELDNNLKEFWDWKLTPAIKEKFQSRFSNIKKNSDGYEAYDNKKKRPVYLRPRNKSFVLVKDTGNWCGFLRGAVQSDKKNKGYKMHINPMSEEKIELVLESAKEQIEQNKINQEGKTQSEYEAGSKEMRESLPDATDSKEYPTADVVPEAGSGNAPTGDLSEKALGLLDTVTENTYVPTALLNLM
jgi:hypothetical protein